MSKTQEVCSLQNGFNNKNRRGRGVPCDFLTTGREELGVRDRGGRDSTVPGDPTGRAYCTEVGVGLDRGLAGMA